MPKSIKMELLQSNIEYPITQHLLNFKNFKQMMMDPYMVSDHCGPFSIVSTSFPSFLLNEFTEPFGILLISFVQSPEILTNFWWLWILQYYAK